ncbi:MAG: hypothetical protein ACUVTO_07040 [Candidatus Caldatribacteriaceae bacterium]
MIEGGYTADEPERYMALHHFYDPVGANQGGDVPHRSRRYTVGLRCCEGKPQDGCQGVGSPAFSVFSRKGHRVHGKGFLAPHSQEKKALFAAAWCSLGETMHLLADMTVPAHVRNDSHPGVAWTEYITDNYRADPYEEYVDEKVVRDSMATGQADPGLLREINSISEELRDLLKARKLFDFVAAYTNRNYFSLDTVVGTERVRAEVD